MAEMLELRAARLGITFHRNRTLIPFPHATAHGGALLDVLLEMTRPAVRIAKKSVSQTVKAHQPISGPVILPQGMVPHRQGVVGLPRR